MNKISLIDYTVFLQSLGTLCERSIDNLLTNVQSFLKTKDIHIVVKESERPKPIIKVPDDYDRKDVDALLRFATQEERDTFTYFLCTGMRDSEVTFSTWENAKVLRRQCTVRAKPDLGFRMKTNLEGSVIMPDKLFAMLKARKARFDAAEEIKPNPETTRLRDLIFPSPDGGPQFNFLRMLKKLALRAGLNCGHCYTSKTVLKAGVKVKTTVCCSKEPCCELWTLHKFRRTYATRLSDENVPVDEIRQSLRHKNIETTMLYLAPHLLKSADMKKKVNQAFA